MQTPKEKIDNIIERLGITGTKASLMMGITHDRYRKNTSANEAYEFNENNYTDLLDFLITELKTLISLKKVNDNSSVTLEMVVDKYFHIFLNHERYSKQEGWNLFDELKLVVDIMATSIAFGDEDIYTKVIDDILFQSTLTGDPNGFTIEKYNDYVAQDRVNNHQRWHNYIIRRRQRTINDILNS